MVNLQYKNPLKPGNTLEIFCGDNLIFENNGKWLYPLFNAEKSIATFKGNLFFHDTVVGKAAAVLMIKLGAKAIHCDLISKLAVDFINSYNKTLEENDKIIVSWNHIVDKILCATESELEKLNDLDLMYCKIKGRSQGKYGVHVLVKNLNYHFGNINDLSLEIEAGSHLMILGDNGAGKTTFLRLLAGVYKPVSGKIIINGKDISHLEKRTIGYIPQQIDNGDFSLSVEEVVGLGVNLHGKEKKSLIYDSLRKVSSINLLHRSFCDLSGGEKQKVSIARCLAQKAKLLLLDEPTAALDKNNKKIVIDLIRSFSVTESPTIIISTHDEELINLPNWKKLTIGNDFIEKEPAFE